QLLEFHSSCRMHATGHNRRYQAPEPAGTTNTSETQMMKKFQTFGCSPRSARLRSCIFNFHTNRGARSESCAPSIGIWVFFGAWNLEFGILKLLSCLLVLIAFSPSPISAQTNLSK